ncbi:MAG: hypothetical protein KDK90_28860 [Leptospiraceae bacterium]|nr:hypothetical protein [Leptospiraceae bacterium]
MFTGQDQIDEVNKKTQEALIIAILLSSGGTSNDSGSSCCKYCGSDSQACGDSCVSNSYNCIQNIGCACSIRNIFKFLDM